MFTLSFTDDELSLTVTEGDVLTLLSMGHDTAGPYVAPFALTVDQARILRDYLSRWLERR